jgi:hypothetical protein
MDIGIRLGNLDQVNLLCDLHVRIREKLGIEATVWLLPESPGTREECASVFAAYLATRLQLTALALPMHRLSTAHPAMAAERIAVVAALLKERLHLLYDDIDPRGRGGIDLEAVTAILSNGHFEGVNPSGQNRQMNVYPRLEKRATVWELKALDGAPGDARLHLTQLSHISPQGLDRYTPNPSDNPPPLGVVVPVIELLDRFAGTQPSTTARNRSAWFASTRFRVYDVSGLGTGRLSIDSALKLFDTLGSA